MSGIRRKFTNSYTSQQNGVVERKHRHLLNVGRALRFQANLPLQFWGESLLTATYLINRLPTPVLNHKSPYELLYGKPPIYTHLRAFGCEAFSHVPKEKQSKLDNKAVKCVCIDYGIGVKRSKLKCLDLLVDG